MKLEVTELGPSKRALKIEIPPDEIKRQFVKAYEDLNRQVRIPGFRPGKAPMALLEKRYAKAVEEDVVRALIPDYYDRAVRQAGIVPVLVEVPPLERIKIKKDAPLSFTATVEIKPKIELRDYKAPNPISLKPDKRTVSDEQVARALEALREQQAQLHPAPSGTALAEGDYAILDVEGFVDGEPLSGTQKSGHLHKIGSKSLVLGMAIDEQLTGKREGDVVQIHQPYPASHPDTRVAGKTAEFRIKIAAVKQKKLPPLDDEFAKDCGPYHSLQELTEKLKGELEKALKKDIEEGYKNQILKRLVETHHFDTPDTLVERELDSMTREYVAARRRKASGSNEPDDPFKQQDELKQFREQSLPEARRRVKIGLILEAIAQKEGLRVEEQDFAAELERLASALKISPTEIRRMVQAGGQEMVEDMKGRILADKALEFVYRHAVIQG
jgi:trigger factor